MKKPVDMEWTKGLPDHTLLTSADVLKIFGYEPWVTNVPYHIKNGNIPKSDKRVSRGRKIPRNYWRLGTIRDLH